jgi:hypothetical protein
VLQFRAGAIKYSHLQQYLTVAANAHGDLETQIESLWTVPGDDEKLINQKKQF